MFSLRPVSLFLFEGARGKVLVPRVAWFDGVRLLVTRCQMEGVAVVRWSSWMGAPSRTSAVAPVVPDGIRRGVRFRFAPIRALKSASTDQ